MVRKQTPEKRASILEAATQAFCNEGYDTTSMDRIAELAGASKRTVYNYFPSKEALFLAVLGALIEKRRAAKHVGWDPERPLAAQLADMARSKSVHADDPTELALTRMALGVLVTHPELAATAMANGDDPMVTWLEMAVAAGRLEVPDPALAAKVFWGMASGVLFWPPLMHGPLPETRREALIDELVATFLARYQPPHPT